MADRNTAIKGVQIHADVAGAGLGKDANGNLELDLNELSSVAVDVANDEIAIIDNGDSSTKKEAIADIVTAIAGSGLTATNGVLSVDTIANNIVEGDIQKEDESSNCDGITTAFTLSNTPLANSLQVYLNGLLLQEGSGNDYTVSGTTVTIPDAPETGDLLIIHYIIDNA